MEKGDKVRVVFYAGLGNGAYKNKIGQVVGHYKNLLVKVKFKGDKGYRFFSKGQLSKVY